MEEIKNLNKYIRKTIGIIFKNNPEKLFTRTQIIELINITLTFEKDKLDPESYKDVTRVQYQINQNVKKDIENEKYKLIVIHGNKHYYTYTAHKGQQIEYYNANISNGIGLVKKYENKINEVQNG